MPRMNLEGSSSIVTGGASGIGEASARLLADAGVAVIAITDNPLSPLVELTDTWCEVEIPAIGPFDSSVPVVAIAELLVRKVVARALPVTSIVVESSASVALARA